MRRPKRRAGRLGVAGVALAAGLVGGGAIGLLSQEPEPTAVHRPLEVPHVTPVAPTLVVPDTFLAWTPGGLPDGLGRAVAALPAIDHAVTVASGTAWLTSSTSDDGTRVDHPPAGLAIPLEVASASLRDYEPFLPPADRSLLPALARGEAVLGESSAALRHLGPGSTLVFGPLRIRVAGVVPDTEIGAHEVFVERRVAVQLGVAQDRYLLIDPREGRTRAKLGPRIRKLLPPGVLLRIRGPGETPFFRQGDAVLPPVKLKEWFGEFAAKPVAGGFLAVDPAWVATHIVTARVPVLGRVTCNRALIPQLRGALESIEREGLARLIDRADYAGCYSSRFINRNPESGISHHAWGVALDVNVSANPFGQTPHQDPRVVAIFKRWGFVWGGDWLLPDGMHFEFVRFPSGG